VIDDDANVRRSVRQVLRIAGWSLEQAIDGEALPFLAKPFTQQALQGRSST
jgi:FixJ family two-component response regulator